MTELPNIRLNLSSRPENVLLVRELLTGVAEAIELGPGESNDIRTAVTEACNNVILHAYEDEAGPLEIEIYASSSAIEVIVRDRGKGIGRQHSREALSGIGVPVIQALTHHVDFRDAAGNGTEVRMEFTTPQAAALGAHTETGLELPILAPADLATTMGIAIAPAPLARAVLPRLLSVLAARAHFSTDRISDTQVLADALLAHLPGALQGAHLGVGVDVAPHNLELLVGPLRAGRGRQLVADLLIDGLGPLIEKLTSRHSLAVVGAFEVLSLELSDETPGRVARPSPPDSGRGPEPMR